MRKKYSPIFVFAIVILIYLLSFILNSNLIYFNKKFPLFQNDLEIKAKHIKNYPIIFIGGYGRSGTTLVRAILDAHPRIRCGPETKIIPTLLGFLTKYLSTRGVQNDLNEAGISSKLLDEALNIFIFYVLKYRKYNQDQRLCVKDPDILHYIKYLHKIFPKSKFIHVIRDGRSAAYSFMKRVKEPLTFSKFRVYLSSWNSYNRYVDQECINLGEKYCFQVKYENLVTNSTNQLEKLMKFLDEPWSDELLKHANHFEDNEIQVSELEWSTDQIKNPIYNNSLGLPWLVNIKNYNTKAISVVAPMLKKFGYEVSDHLDERIESAENRNRFLMVRERKIYQDIEKMFLFRKNGSSSEK